MYQGSKGRANGSYSDVLVSGEWLEVWHNYFMPIYCPGAGLQMI